MEWRARGTLEWNLQAEYELTDSIPTQQENIFEVLLTEFSNGESIQASQAYEFRVAAKNVEGWGLWTAPILITAVSAPDAPMIEYARVEQEQGLIAVKWSVPKTNGAEITGYKFVVKQRLGDINQVQDCSSAPELECYISIDMLLAPPYNLKLGDIVQFKVLANSDLGDSPYASGEILLAFKPLTPEGPYIVNTNQDQIGLSWDAPDAQGSPITSYVVSYRE